MKKLLALMLLVAFVGCASDDKPSTDKSDADASAKEAEKAAAKAEKKEEQKSMAKARSDLICPQVAIVTQAQEVFDYGGEKADPSQLVAKAKMKSISGDCGYQQNGIDISFTLHMVAARGPRLGTQASFPYFVAIVDPAEAIVSRQIVTAHFALSGDDKALEKDEDLHVFIPLAEPAQLVGPDYRVLVGFKVPQDQLKQ